MKIMIVKTHSVPLQLYHNGLESAKKMPVCAALDRARIMVYTVCNFVRSCVVVPTFPLPYEEVTPIHPEEYAPPARSCWARGLPNWLMHSLFLIPRISSSTCGWRLGT